MIPIILIIISLLLDGVLTNYLPYLVNNLSWFTPLFTVVIIFILYPFFRKKEKKYFLLIFLLGILYDLLYTNLLFWNALIFLFIALLSKYLYKNLEVTPIKLVLYTIIIIVAYESLNACIIVIFQLVPITLEKLLYKISHTLLINIIYMEIIYFILKIIPKKYKKISIN